jgi:hypothetical protein
MLKRIFTSISFFCLACTGILHGQDVRTREADERSRQVFQLQNENITCKVMILDNQLEGDSLIGNPLWLGSFGSTPFILYTDGGFGLQFTWTDWQAPKKLFNADNPVVFDKTDMEMNAHRFVKMENGGAELELTFNGTNSPLLVKVTYHLDPGTFFFKRKISVSDTTFGYHFLEKIHAFSGNVSGFGLSGIRTATKMFEESSSMAKPLQTGSSGSFFADPVSIIKPGEFGQPVALGFQQTSAFFALEYPASENRATPENIYQSRIVCTQEFGRKVGKEAVETDWTVEAIVPTLNVKDWFFRYVDAIRVAPATPYTLYNSWYDLRSPDYPKIQPDHFQKKHD